MSNSHHWAPISGSIDESDPSALAAAWREIREETTLTPESLELIRTGKPFTFSDPSIWREWTVHPFGYRLKTKAEGGKGEEGIHIDWEHEGWGWHDPSAVIEDKNFDGVPRLKDSLSRVWFYSCMGESAGKILADGLDTLKNDHESGARELAAISLSIFRNVIAEMRDDLSSESCWETIRMTGWHLWKNGRESMGAAIINTIVNALTAIEPIVRDSKINPATKRNEILAAIDKLIERRKSTGAAVSDAFTSYLQTNFVSRRKDVSTIKILTLSASSTIRESLIHAASALDVKTIEFHVLESRPLYEGVSIASAIQSRLESSSTQLQTTIYTDASVAIAAKDVDVLVIGADRISSSGKVSNKVGSLPAVLSAKNVNPGIKVVVLSEIEKIAEPDGTSEPVVEDNDPNEVINAWKSNGVKGFDVISKELKKEKGDHAGIAVRNIYFEWVPAEFIDAYICEEGSWDTSRIQARSQWVGEQIDNLFANL